MKCAFCEHPQRSDLEGQLIRSELTMTEIAHIIGRDKSAISRHMKYHVPRAVAEVSLPEPVEVSGLNVVNQLVQLNNETQLILREARAVGDNRTALKAIDSALKQLGAMAELTGQLSGSKEDYDVQDILRSRLWQVIQTEFLELVDPYPEIKEAIVKKLKEEIAEEEMD